MKKLLDIPFKYLLVYGLLVFVAAIPIYHYTVEWIWLEELDEHNLMVAERIEKHLSETPLGPAEISQLQSNLVWMNPGVKLVSIQPSECKEDSLYEIEHRDNWSGEGDMDRFRGRYSCIESNGNYYALMVETNVEESDETFIAITIVTILSFLVFLFGMLFINRNISKRSWKPFYAILDRLSVFEPSKGRLEPLESTHIKEFNDLQIEIEKLMERSISSFNAQKKFTENAAHELQTPLAILQSHYDVLLQSEEESIRQALVQIEEPLNRLKRVNKNILLLARIENEQFGQVENVDLGEIYTKAIMLFSELAESKGLTLSAAEVKDSILVSCNPFLLETLVYNLLSNAIRHCQPQGVIEVELDAKRFTVSNTGKFELDEHTIFKRFSASDTSSGGGLGLAIAVEIAERYGWKINYVFQAQMHHFTLKF